MSDQLSSDLASLRIQRDAPPERGKTLTYVVVSLLVIGGAGVAYAIGVPYFEAKVFRPEVSASEIVVVSPAEGAVELTATGYVVAEKVSKVGAKVPGRIAAIHVKE